MKAAKSFLILLMFFSVANSLRGLGRRVPTPISMLQLIANPEKYDGKIVATIGFLEVENNRSPDTLRSDDTSS